MQLKRSEDSNDGETKKSSKKKQLLQYAIETDVEKNRDDDDDENMIKPNKKGSSLCKKPRNVPYRYQHKKGVAISITVVEICLDVKTT